jgi:hypothetical protein
MQLSSHSDHARHDVTLIAGHAAGDLSESERSLAEALLAECTTCVDVRRDLVAIAAATRALPAPFTLSRDFRLDPAQAHRLRRGSWLRAALRPFAAGGTVVRPMAAAFTSLGIAGLLVATVIPGILGSPSAPAEAGAPGAAYEMARGTDGAENAPTVARQAASAAPQALATRDRLGPAAALPSAGTAEDMSTGQITTTGGYAQAYRSGVPVAAGGNVTPGADDGAPSGRLQSASPTISPLIAGSLALLAVGLLLFGLRIGARRLR